MQDSSLVDDQDQSSRYQTSIILPVAYFNSGSSTSNIFSYGNGIAKAAHRYKMTRFEWMIISKAGK